MWIPIRAVTALAGVELKTKAKVPSPFSVNNGEADEEEEEASTDSESAQESTIYGPGPSARDLRSSNRPLDRRNLTIGDGDGTHDFQDSLELLTDPNTHFARAFDCYCVALVDLLYRSNLSPAPSPGQFARIGGVATEPTTQRELRIPLLPLAAHMC